MDDGKMVMIFGIKSCDTCRKARQDIEKAGKEVRFVDIRETPLSDEKVNEFVAFFPDAIVNRRSTTWRNLSESERNLEIHALVAQFPTVMKRPLIINGEIKTIGWDAKARIQHLGTSDSND